MSIKKQSEQQIYGRNDMIMLEQNNKIYGSLGLADRYVMKTEEGTRLILSNPKLGSFDDVLTEFNIYGMSKQVVMTGKNLCSIKSCQLSTNIVESDIVLWTKSSQVYYAFDTQNISGSEAYLSISYYNADKKKVGSNGITTVCDGTRKTGSFNGKYAMDGSDIDLTTIEYILVRVGLYDDSVKSSFIDNIIVSGDKIVSYEPYTGGKPSPSPEYPKEIASVGGNGSIEVNVRGKNLVDIYGYSTNGMDNPEDKRALNNAYGTTLNTTEKTDKLIVNQEILDGAVAGNYTSGYFCIGINRKLEVNKYYIITFRINVIRNPLSMSEVFVSFNGITFSKAEVIGDKVTVKVEYKELGKRQYIEVRNNGMSVELSDFMITEVGETDDYVPYTEQTVQLHHILNAIPVASGTSGITYTDADGQAWIADEIDFSRGKYVQRVWQKTFDGSESWGLYGNTGFLLDNILPEKMSNREMLCNQFMRRGGGTNSNIMIVGAFSSNSSIYIENCTLVNNTLVDDMLSKWKMHLAKHPLVVTTYLNEQVERDLAPEEIEAYQSLVTYDGTTVVENDAECYMKITYMAKGN